MASVTDTRRNPRYEMACPVKVIAPQGDTTMGTLQNISRGGMLIAFPVELELGRTYQIEIPDGEGTFRLHGEALRIHLPPRTATGLEARLVKVGFEFVGTDAAARERLDRLLVEAAR